MLSQYDYLPFADAVLGFVPLLPVAGVLDSIYFNR